MSNKTRLVVRAGLIVLCLAASSSSVFAQTRVIVTADLATIWRNNVAIVAAIASAGTELEVVAQWEGFYEVVVPEALGGQIRRGLIARSQVRLVEGSPAPPVRTTRPSGQGSAPPPPTTDDVVPLPRPRDASQPVRAPAPPASIPTVAPQPESSATVAPVEKPRVLPPVVDPAGMQESLGIHGPVRVVNAAQLTGAIVIDGRLDDEAWARIPASGSFLQREPDEGTPATEATEVRIAYDDDALYVGIMMHDREPAGIVSRLTRRDSTADADRVTVYLDPYLDHRTGVMFEVSAAGVQNDALIYDDEETEDTWDAVWHSAVERHAGGWNAELRIPFSQLRFSTAPTQIWGIQVVRYIQRKAEEAWLELVPKDANWLASRMAHLTGLSGVRPGANLELLPYVVSRADFVAPEPGDPFNDGSEFLASAGLDLKWGLASNLTLDATVRPDFGQVEVDPAEINLTEFETSFDEKRPFFLEGSQIFEPVAGESLFYSRRIGRPPQGDADGDFVEEIESTTILGASKLTGRTNGGWTFGFLDAVTDRMHAATVTDGVHGETEVEPLTNYLVGRVKGDGQRAGVGATMTSVNRQLRTEDLIGRLASSAYAASGDGYFYLDSRRDWEVSAQGGASLFQGDASAVLRQQRSSRRYYQRPDAAYVDVNPAATSMSGWTSEVNLKRNSGTWRVSASASATSPGYEINDLGFLNRADWIATSTTLSWRNSVPNAWSRNRSTYVSKSYGWNFGRQEQEDSWSVGGAVTFKNYWYTQGNVSMDASRFDDHLTRGGPLGGAPIRKDASVTLGSDGRKTVFAYLTPSYSFDDAGGWSSSLSFGVTYRPSSTISLSASPYYYRSRSATQYFTTVADPLAVATYGARYVFANLGQRGGSLTTRLDVTLTPKISAQIYMEPFLGSGTYSDFREFLRPAAFEFARYGQDQGSIEFDPVRNVYVVDPDGAGPATPFRLGNSDFNVGSLVLKSVLRWEWRPGSTLYLAWTQGRSDSSFPSTPNLARDARLLFRAPADDVFMIKTSFWLAR